MKTRFAACLSRVLPFLLGVVAALALLLSLLWFRRRRKDDGPPTTPGPDSDEVRR